MAKAFIVIREKDPETEAICILDMVEVAIPSSSKDITKMLGQILTRFFLEANTPRSDISDIQIEFRKD